MKIKFYILIIAVSAALSGCQSADPVKILMDKIYEGTTEEDFNKYNRYRNQSQGILLESRLNTVHGFNL